MSLLDNMNQTAAGGLTGGKPQSQLLVMGLDALGGYVFARMAHNGGEMNSESPSELIMLLLRIGIVTDSMLRMFAPGYDICPYNVAAAAGAVYGAITGLFHTILGCMAGMQSYEASNGHYTVTNMFGTVSGYDAGWQTRGGVW